MIRKKKIITISIILFFIMLLLYTIYMNATWDKRICKQILGFNYSDYKVIECENKLKMLERNHGSYILKLEMTEKEAFEFCQKYKSDLELENEFIEVELEREGYDKKDILYFTSLKFNYRNTLFPDRSKGIDSAYAFCVRQSDGVCMVIVRYHEC